MERYLPEVIQDYLLEDKRVEAIFGPGSMKEKALRIIAAGLTLSHLESLYKFDKLIDTIKRHFESGMTEAMVATHFKRNSIGIELYPRLDKKEPDLKLKWQNSWIYIEITRLRPKNQTAEKLERLSKELLREKQSRYLNISCLREPKTREVFKILSGCKRLLYEAKKDFSYKELNLRGLCILSFNPKNGSGLHLDLRTFVIRQKLSDFLKREKRQLSENEMGIIMVDIGDYEGRIDRLVNSIENRIAQVAEMKFGGIVISETDITDYLRKSQLRQLQVIRNSFGNYDIPEDFWHFLLSSVKK